jgi:hypothetical protein
MPMPTISFALWRVIKPIASGEHAWEMQAPTKHVVCCHLKRHLSAVEISGILSIFCLHIFLPFLEKVLETEAI